MLEFYEQQQRDLFEFLPLTFNIKTQKEMSNYEEFTVMQKESQAIWIVKPGENSNRGRGIRIFDKICNIKKFL